MRAVTLRALLWAWSLCTAAVGFAGWAFRVATMTDDELERLSVVAQDSVPFGAWGWA